MAAHKTGTRVRVINFHPALDGREGEVLEWRGSAFRVRLDGLGTHFFEPEQLDRALD